MHLPMKTAHLVWSLERALNAIVAPRYYETERGFQGALIAELSKFLPGSVLPPGAIVEQEYQKTLQTHGMRIRPDLIIHEPFHPSRHSGRDIGNHAVFELKFRGGKQNAADDIDSLGRMIEVLRYPIGIFINIDSDATHEDAVPTHLKDRILCFAVRLDSKGKPRIARPHALPSGIKMWLWALRSAPLELSKSCTALLLAFLR